MQILNQNLTELAINLGLVITGLALLLLVIITIVHWITDRRLDHSMLFDRFKRPMIMSYLEGKTPKVNVVRAIEKEPTEAMRLLLEVSRKLQPEAQAKLMPIFAEMPGVDKEADALHSKLTKRRLAAAERLGLLKGAASDQALLEALEDEVLAVRYSAACSLAEHRNPDHIEPILLAFDAEHEINWYRLVEIMTEYGDKAVPTLLRVIANPTGRYTHNLINVAIRSLGVLRAKSAVEPLIAKLKDPDFSIRLNAAHALGDIGDPAALDALAELRSDPEWSVRNDAIEAMEKLHPDEKLPELVEALYDPSWWVRYTAAQAICSVGWAGVQTLRVIMQNTYDPYVHDICKDVLSEQGVASTDQHLTVRTGPPPERVTTQNLQPEPSSP